MRAAAFHGPGDIRLEDVPDARIERPTDALIRITHSCVCGSDLWIYRGIVPAEPGARMGHEWLGTVTDIGAEVRTLKPGDRVVAPFSFSDGTCEFCRSGLYTSCPNGGGWGGKVNGGQAEAICAPYADATLVRVPDSAAENDSALTSLLPLTDVMATGHHAAISAGIRPESDVVVVGDGAVALCAVLAARRLGARRIIVSGHHQERLELARQMGATDTVTTDETTVVDQLRSLTDGGAKHVMECVGNQGAMDTAVQVARPGGTIGFVGVPAGVRSLDIKTMFVRNLTLRGGVAPVRRYLPELLADVIAGRFDPSPVFDMTLPLANVQDGYAAMDERRAIKVVLRP